MWHSNFIPSFYWAKDNWICLCLYKSQFRIFLIGGNEKNFRSTEDKSLTAACRIQNRKPTYQFNWPLFVKLVCIVTRKHMDSTDCQYNHQILISFALMQVLINTIMPVHLINSLLIIYFYSIYFFPSQNLLLTLYVDYPTSISLSCKFPTNSVV